MLYLISYFLIYFHFILNARVINKHGKNAINIIFPSQIVRPFKIFMALNFVNIFQALLDTCGKLHGALVNQAGRHMHILFPH